MLHILKKFMQQILIVRLRKKNVLFKIFESQGTTSLELCIISDENKITQEELKDAVVYVAVYDENGKMEKLESLTKSKEEVE